VQIESMPLVMLTVEIQFLSESLTLAPLEEYILNDNSISTIYCCCVVVFCCCVFLDMITRIYVIEENKNCDR
jgi:predicted RND superfamily exporter protein